MAVSRLLIVNTDPPRQNAMTADRSGPYIALYEISLISLRRIAAAKAL
jgi:hypothetical protein